MSATIGEIIADENVAPKLPLTEAAAGRKRSRKTKSAPVSPNIEVVDNIMGVESVIAHADAPYSRGVAWTKAGLDVTKTMSSAEALDAAKLNWEVDVAPVVNSVTGKPIENFSAIYRTDTGAALGVSGGRYTPLQNHEMFKFTDDLVQDGQARYVSAGQFYGGKRVWLLMEMTDGLTIAGEEYRPFLMATTGHDLNAAFRAFTTVMRVYCLNTFNMALRGQDNGVRIHHHAQIHTAMSAASKLMKATNDQQRRLAEWLEQAAETPLKRGHAEKIETQLFGEITEESHAIKRNSLELFREVWTVEKSKNGDTAYSAFNAVTGYADHGMRIQGKDEALRAERRLKSITDGQARDFKVDGLRVIASTVMSKVPSPIIIGR